MLSTPNKIHSVSSSGIKQRIFSRSKPLQETAKREIERSKRPKKLNPPVRQLQMPCLNDENEPVAGPQFKKIVVKGATLATNGPDSCCEMTDGSVVQVQNLIAAENGTIIVGKKFSRTMDFYEYPIPSSLLGIRKVSNLLACSTYWTPEDVQNKCYLLPLNDNEYVSYSVVEFNDEGAVHVVPTTAWLDEDPFGNLVVWWPPGSWSDSRRNKAIEKCSDFGTDFSKLGNIKILHSYNNYLIARRNTKIAEDTSNLETENEEEIGKRKRQQRRLNQIVGSDDESPAKRSKHAAPPAFKKSLSEKIRDKLSSSNVSPNKNSPQVPVDELVPLEVCAIVHDTPESPVARLDADDNLFDSSVSKNSPCEARNGRSSPRKSSKSLRSEKSTSASISTKNVSQSWSSEKITPVSGRVSTQNIIQHHANSISSVITSEEIISPTTFPNSPLSLDHDFMSVQSDVRQVSRQLFSSISANGKKSPRNKKSPSKQDSTLTPDTGVLMKIGRLKVSTKPVSAAEHLTLVQLCVEMREKMERMERLLSSVLRAVKPSQKLVVPKDLPMLPLKSLDEFEKNEVFLDEKANRTDTVDYLSKLVVTGIAVKDQVYGLLRKTLSDGLASKFNWKGTRDKLPFSESKLAGTITGALLDFHQENNLKIDEVEEAMKGWLKYAPKRMSNPTTKWLP